MLSIDDSQRSYSELYDPNIKEFYGSNALPAQIWHPTLMSSREVWEACGYVESGGLFEFDESEYNFIAWSWMKIDADIENDEDIVWLLEEWFLSAGGTLSWPDKPKPPLVVPLDCINLVLINGIGNPEDAELEQNLAR